jgi:two-component system response regulator AtoC
MKHILVVDDEESIRVTLSSMLSHRGYYVTAVDSAQAALEKLKQGDFDVVLADVRMPDIDGITLTKQIVSEEIPITIIIMSAYGSVESAIEAMKAGAYDYITKPFKIDQLLLSIDKALSERSLRNEVTRLREEVSRRDRLDHIIGRSAPMQEIFALIRRLSVSNANLLVTGESGTGKELIARAVHARSPRKGRPFVPVNCAAIPENLLESELFGYARGAHSTANTDRQGLFVEADGGTLFLDEIAELPLSLQPKLLRVLQDGEVRPLGTNRAERADVRVIAATNRDLERALREGRFREDLYYRLNVIQLHLPPLRGRQDDILALADHFLLRSVGRSAKPVRGWKESAKKLLLAYHWPGNVRELENVVERAVALAEGEFIGPDDLPRALQERRGQDLLSSAVAQGFTLDQLEREFIERVLELEGGNKTRTAQRLGLDRKTLYRKLEEYASSPRNGAPPPANGNDPDASGS